MKKITDSNTISDIARIMNCKINVYFVIMLVMLVLNVFILRNISEQLYWHNKTSIEAMACVKDQDCNLNSAIDALEEAERDYYPPEYAD